MNIACFKKIGLVLQVAGVALLSGCYSPMPIPSAVNADKYTPLNKEDHTVLPDDCSVLSLEMATKLALQNNPDFISTLHSMSAAWARYRQSFSSYFPTVTASYGLNQDRFQPSYQHGVLQDNRDTTAESRALSAQWTIFDGLVRTMNMLAEKHTAEKTAFDNKDSRRLLIKSVEIAYNNILLGYENIRISKADMEFNEKLLKETELKYDAGAVALSEVLNFKIKVNDAQIASVQAKYNLKNAKHILGELMGLTEGTIPEPVGFPSLETSGEAVLDDIGIYLDTALENRPDLKGYREALKAAEYTLYARYGAYSPTVTVDAGVGYGVKKNVYGQKEANRRTGANRGESKYTTRQRSWTHNYGGTVSWTVFSGGERYNKIREAQALLEQSRFDVVGKWINIVSEVRQAYDTYLQNSEQLEIYKKNLDLVKKTRDLVEEEYKAGNTSLTRLNEAQRDLVKADTDLVSSMINLNNAKVQLDAATAAKQ